MTTTAQDTLHPHRRLLSIAGVAVVSCFYLYFLYGIFSWSCLVLARTLGLQSRIAIEQTRDTADYTAATQSRFSILVTQYRLHLGQCTEVAP